MNHFLITYHFATGSQQEWHDDIVTFITALENDPELRGKISYRCMKSRDGAGYYHLAAAVDDGAAKLLGERAYFSRYTQRSDVVSGGTVEVLPLELVAETTFRA